MGELLEQIKQLSYEERQALLEQIRSLDEVEREEDEEFKAELVRRAQEMIRNPGKGKTWQEVEARLRADIEDAQRP